MAAILLTEISFGQTVSQCRWFEQLPNPSSSIWLIILSARFLLSIFPWGKRSKWLIFAATNNEAEAFGQTAAALTAHGIDKTTYENKLVFLMGVEKARFRNPVIPDCKLLLKIEAIRSHGRVWKYKGEAFVEDKKMADAIWSATIVDKK